MQNLFKKKLCNQTPPKILNFQPQGASGWQHEPKRVHSGGGQERSKTVMFAARNCLGASMAPKSPQASILAALLINFGSFSNVFETFFIDLFHFCLHLPWVEGATENN